MSGGDADEVYRRFAPERLLIRQVRAADDSDSVVLALDPRAPWIAELGSRGRSVAWYDPALESARKAADSDAGGQRWARLFGDASARWLLLRPAKASEALRRGLVRAGASRVSAVGDAELWSLAAEKAAQAK